MSKNDNPIENINEFEADMCFNDFKFKNDFAKICDLTPKPELQK
jgi:hypothetical protein